MDLKILMDSQIISLLLSIIAFFGYLSFNISFREVTTFSKTPLDREGTLNNLAIFFLSFFLAIPISFLTNEFLSRIGKYNPNQKDLSCFLDYCNWIIFFLIVVYTCFILITNKQKKLILSENNQYMPNVKLCKIVIILNMLGIVVISTYFCYNLIIARSILTGQNQNVENMLPFMLIGVCYFLQLLLSSSYVLSYTSYISLRKYKLFLIDNKILQCYIIAERSEEVFIKLDESNNYRVEYIQNHFIVRKVPI